MSQRAVESILGRLITDESLRKEFFREPVETCRRNHWEVTPAELSALLGLDPVMLQDMAGSLDPKIVRAVVTDSMSDDSPPAASEKKSAFAATQPRRQ